MSKKVLITGSNGFLGSWIVEACIKQGYNTFAGVRKGSNIENLTDPRINFFYYSFEKEDNLRSQLSAHKFDYIILNAGITNSLKRSIYFDINAGYTRRLCKILMEENIIPEKVILLSSLAAYGPADFQVKQILDKDAVPHPTTWYGESKLQAERYMEGFRQIPHIIFRPTAVYGPRDYAMLSVYKAIKSGIAAKIGKGSLDATFIYVEDLARLVTDSLAAPVVNKAYFVGDGNIYPIEVLNKHIAEILDKKTVNLTIPISIMKLIATLSEGYGRLRGTTPILNRNKVKEYYARSFAIDTEDLKKDFNFVPAYSLKEALEETISWCKENNLI